MNPGRTSTEKQVHKALKAEGDSRKIDWVRQRDWRRTQGERLREQSIVTNSLDTHRDTQQLEFSH